MKKITIRVIKHKDDIHVGKSILITSKKYKQFIYSQPTSWVHKFNSNQKTDAEQRAAMKLCETIATAVRQLDLLMSK